MHTGNKFEMLARSGYAARGVVYFVVGAMALLSVAGGSGGSVGSEGALSALLAQPFGWILLFITGLGLVGHSLWRLAQSVLNADGRDDSLKCYVIRAALFVSAVTHAFLALNAFQIALAGVGGESKGEAGAAAWLMQQPFGRWLVGAAGLAILGAGAAQIFKGFSGGFDKWLAIPSKRMPLIFAICAAGLVARGVIFLIVGVFFLYAGFMVDSSQAGGLADALAWVRSLPFGPWLYGLAAAGLFAFGGYSVIEALYRRMDTNAVGAGKRKVAAALE
ncbi:MAG: DUF1206 domain-containing protein [Pseudaminobacter sp.]|nr:DUF1206 domain-containing protein [Pseudaminobacter sp.]